eukprot:356783-Chlamydomonas_euryale.AAC.1
MDCCDTELDAPQLLPHLPLLQGPWGWSPPAPKPRGLRAATLNAASMHPTLGRGKQGPSCTGAEVLRSCARRVARGQGVRSRLTPVLCLTPTGSEARYACQKVWVWPAQHPH